ncbi:PAS domain-containing protein [Devosia rhodophyticola]|uniref:Blue-light-activated histidine kinase n=1 Tax=Devosia rhodophyticola TaxID=3026423 RepID=A0ABY7YYB7_9HYPH|nr:PAS domain-containing protein [Devosia rhodophyticola]WDR06351.1 PAS domain-containing protein [Devosia rhodophyticola]
MPRTLFPAATPELRVQLEAFPTLKLINDYDWAASPLGPISSWADSVKGVVRMLVTASAPMVVLLGPEGILIYNDAYAKFAGDRHPEIFGRPAMDAWPEVADFNRERIAGGLRGETLVLHDAELSLNRHGQPEPVWLDLNYSPILGDDGRSLGALCIVHETTDRVMTEAALTRSEERLSLALSGSNLVGTWDWDVDARRVTADDLFASLHNIDPLRAGIGVPAELIGEAIHPDDLERVTEGVEAALRFGADFHSEHRVVASDGTVRWLVASGRARVGSDGKAARFPGVVVDVTEQKQAVEALAESEAKFRTLADTMPQMVWSTLPDGMHDYYNARWYEYTGVPPGSTDGEAWNGMFHPDDRDRAWAAWRHSLATGEPYKIEYRLRHRSGNYRWTLGLALPIRDADGKIVRWFGTCTDIHETRLLAEERELIAQELSHRIKNIFSVMTGIISLSARNQPEMKQFADQLRQRIFALSEAHDFVRPHGPGGQEEQIQSELWALIEKLLTPYQAGDQRRVEFAGSNAIIDEGAATPLALLVHEMATNAAKYGALSVPDGSILLTGSIANDKYTLTWKERGGPQLKPSDHAGFGSRLISLSVEGQLHGKLERVWEVDGLRIEVEVPLSALRRSGKLLPEKVES